MKTGYYESPLRYNNVDWFVDEVIKLDNKMAFYFKKTNKDIILTEKDEEVFRKTDTCRFREKEKTVDKVRDHCHLTSKYRVLALPSCNINVTRKQSFFVPIVFRNFSNFDCHQFFKKLVDRKSDKAKFDTIHKTDEEYMSSYSCIRFIDY